MTMMDVLWVCEILYGAGMVMMVWYPVWRLWRTGYSLLDATCMAGASITWTLKNRIKHEYTDLVIAMLCLLLISSWFPITGVGGVIMLASVGVQAYLGYRYRR